MKNPKGHKSLNPMINRVVVYLPKSINLDNLMFDYPMKNVSYHEKKPQRRKDNIAYLLGQIYSSLYIKSGDPFPDNEYTHICSEYLKSVVSNYQQYMEYLKDIRVIDCDESYHINREYGWVETYCKSYRYSEKYFPKGTGWYKYVIYDPDLVLKHKNRFMFSANDRPEWKQYGRLKDLLDYIRIDVDDAKSTLESLYPGDEDTVDMQLELVRRLRYKDLWTFKIGKTGRLYTPLSNLNKNLRPLIRVQGEPLVEIDIKSSIPFMSLVLFDNNRLKRNKTVRKILEDANPTLRYTYLSKRLVDVKTNILQNWESKSFLFMGDSISYSNRNSYPYNIRHYIELVQSGDVYQYMTDKWNQDHEVVKQYNRKSAKKALLTILNQPSSFKSPERKVFEREFPDVALTFSRLNSGYLRTNNGKGKAKTKKDDIDCPFAYFTQKMEAHIVLDLVVGSLLKSNPKLPLYTIHDAIYTTKENVDTVKNKLTSEVLKLTGLKIEVTTKELVPDFDYSDFIDATQLTKDSSTQSGHATEIEVIPGPSNQEEDGTNENSEEEIASDEEYELPF